MAKSSYLSWPRGGSAQWGKDPAGILLKNSFFGVQPSGSTLLLLGGRLAVGSATLPGAIQLVLSDSGYLKFLEDDEEPLSLSGGFITGPLNEPAPVEVVFGRDSGADASAPLSDNRSIVDRITTTAEGTVVNIIAWFSAAQAASGQWKGVIFADNGSNLPGNILYSTPAQTGGPSRQVATFSGAIVLPAGNYWIGVVTSGMYTNVQSNSTGGVAPNVQLSNDNNFTTPVNWTNPSTANYTTELSCALTLLVGGALPESPINSVAPVISGTLAVGNVLSCTTGTWSGTPTPTYTYQWYRDATPIGSATANTYTTVNADAGANITCTVTATNTAGVQGSTSNTLVPTRAPLTNVSPLVTGNAGVGSVLSVSNGTWYAYPTPTYAYQWKRDGVNIGGATASTYTTQDPADIDADISCAVTATNTHGNATQDSSNAITVTAAASGGMFGTTTTGGATYPTNDDRAWAGKYVLEDSALLTNFNVWRPTASAFAEMKGLIFADVAGTPGALVASTAMVAVPSGGPGFYTIPITGFLPPGTYWIGVVTGGAYVNLTGQATGDTIRGEAYNYPAWDAAWPGGGSSYTGALSVNVEYDIIPAAPTGVAPTYVNTFSSPWDSSTQAAVTVDMSSRTTVDAAYVMVTGTSDGTYTVVDSNSNVYTLDTDLSQAYTGQVQKTFICTSWNGPYGSVTFTATGPADSYPTILGVQLARGKRVLRVGGKAKAVDSSNPRTTTAVNPGYTASLAVAGLTTAITSTNMTHTANNGFTKRVEITAGGSGQWCGVLATKELGNNAADYASFDANTSDLQGVTFGALSLVAPQVYQITPATLSASESSGTVNFNNAFDFVPAAGHSLVVYTNCYHGPGNYPSAVNICGSAATKVSEQTVSGGSVQVWVATVGGSPTRNVSITVSAGTYPTIAGLECDPLAPTASIIDFGNITESASGADATITGSSATGQPYTLVLAQWGPLYGVSNIGAEPASPGWTELSIQQDSNTYQGGVMSYRIFPTSATPSVTWGRDENVGFAWFASMISLKFA